MNAVFGKTGTCTAPAVWLVEGYTFRDGALESLDRTVYACQAHVSVAEVGWLRGLAPHTRSARGLHWCGTFTDYEPDAG
ncbi:hypothetical protein ACFXGI_34665 [Streptomyces sp. NPDC059355]|uniref:hypothetical protein n=1 Tax=Streptomyces sp. NPDC059355 TaxID=3346811 RepID=UPI0036B7E1B4